ncbi:ImmA/IrrE family metallo-endopeptidase [Amycolatopsis sp. MJM2582]|uniref:ImmA/IrrE family metallo-endopeptidase n=1 Tax=Amycolatopsis sp. MJM2582 TaxID=1427749 RepID=UPI00068FAB03|nr:ImmA/IrrE family metallo-endopeptidase [Amycolatopsis sp. MJM2582]
MAFGGSRRELRRRCDDLIETLPIRPGFEVTTFLEELSAQRKTPLTLWRMNATAATPSGMLVTTEAMDYVFVVRGTPLAHVVHILAHELGHLLLGHQCSRSPESHDGRRQPGEELEAEEFAYRFAARVRLVERRHRMRGSYREVLAAFGSRSHRYQYGV